MSERDHELMREFQRRVMAVAADLFHDADATPWLRLEGSRLTVEILFGDNDMPEPPVRVST